MAESGISHVELGFRFWNNSNTFGPFAYTTNSLLERYQNSRVLSLGVMVNASEYHDSGVVNLNRLSEIFPATDSALDFIRIASHLDELGAASEMRSFFEAQGLEVHLNIMKTAELLNQDAATWRRIGDRISGFENVTLADSLGRILPKDIPELVSRAQSSTNATLGVHMHDNLGLALANSLAALEAGIDSIDSTVAGIGRGAGNTKTEFIAGILEEMSIGDYSSAPLLELASSPEAEALHRASPWGPSPLYFVSALGNVHPTYIQEFTKNQTYTNREILKAVKTLQALGAISYSSQRLKKSIDPLVQANQNPHVSEIRGDSLAENWCEGAQIILIGGGDFVESNKEYLAVVLRGFIGKSINIGMSLRTPIPIDILDYLIVFDPIKLSLGGAEDREIDVPVIVPTVGETFRTTFNDVRTHNITSSTYDEEDYSWHTLGYALSTIFFGKPKSIHFVGFDGFIDNQDKQTQTQKIFDFYAAKHPETKQYFSTPTAYAGNFESIFSSKT